MAFFAKVFPEIVRDGRIYIAEPPLYRIDDKKDPFVLNKADYLNRYVKSVTKVYNVGSSHDGKIANVRWFNKKDLTEFLEMTSPYVEEIDMISNHYKVNEQLVEIILRYLSELPGEEPQDIVKHINVQEMMHRIGEKFPELYYDDNDHLIRGVIDGKYQLIEVNEPFVRRCMDLIDILRWIGMRGEEDIVVCAKKGTLTCEDGLLAALKLLDRQKMKILARFKGLKARPYPLNCWEA
ncbi:MAG: hypothetical protein HDQ88_00800 [Clostridia bacterium]|nr:hypothetical protein [Clostridia bacterium]